jgi:SAM-dependent methyltransferase
MMYKHVLKSSSQPGGQVSDIYDRMAPHYRAYAEQKTAYIQAVNATILEFVPAGAQWMLDVGAGDGVRAVELAQAAHIENLILLEPSAEMVKLCAALPVKDIWHGTSDSLPDYHEPGFGLITCLWNVLGHIPGTRARVEALRRMGQLLAPGGRIILDVNNRHNSNAYGKCKVMGRRLLDAVYPDEGRGDVSFTWDIGGEKIPASGHLFTPAEMLGLFRLAGLRLIRSFAIDYKSGKRSDDLCQGQIIFILENKEL